MELKPCPFCGGEVIMTELSQTRAYVNTAVHCEGCGMDFEYAQDFALSKTARVAINPDFITVWNRRADNG